MMKRKTFVQLTLVGLLILVVAGMMVGRDNIARTVAPIIEKHFLIDPLPYANRLYGHEVKAEQALSQEANTYFQTRRRYNNMAKLCEEQDALCNQTALGRYTIERLNAARKLIACTEENKCTRQVQGKKT